MSKTSSDSRSERHIPESLLHKFRVDGESELFRAVIQTSSSEIPGVARNSAREEVLKYVRWANESGSDPCDYMNYGGGYFQSLRGGQPLGHADATNKRIVNHVRNEMSTGVQDL